MSLAAGAGSVTGSARGSGDAAFGQMVEHPLQGAGVFEGADLRLLPNPAFQVAEVIVADGPWATRIAARVRVHAPLPDGSAHDNVFMQNGWQAFCAP